MKQLTIVFLMGGRAQRFGLKFKPFLKIFDKTFLELAIQPFLKHKDSIKEMIFLTTEEQCEEFNIQYRIKSFNLPVSWLIYSTKTADGIIPDINKLIGERSGLNDVIFCDCDHTLNVDEMMSTITSGAYAYDCILPGWQIQPSEMTKWSIALATPEGEVLGIEEKKYPTLASYDNMDKACKYWGVIGCYYFKHYKKLSYIKLTHLSGYIQEMLNWGNSVGLVEVKYAEFFGDPERLKQLYEEKKASTIFCDLDGTIIEHESEPDFSSITLLEGAGEKIEQWRCDNCFIVLTTSRDEQFRPEMEKLLRENKIRYEYLIMGLPPGTRHLINDKKPYADAPMAVGHNVIRNEGIKNLELGNSLATLEKVGDLIYKKIDPNWTPYQLKKFIAQYDSMKRVSKLLPEIMPTIHYLSDATGAYGMEYLDGYVGLHQVEDKVAVLEKLFEQLPKLYADTVKCENNWLEQYMEEKIYSKKQAIADLGLDASEVYGRLESLTIEEYELYSPKFLSTVHGDLTYENIMVRTFYLAHRDLKVEIPRYSIKLIDFDNDNKKGPIEQDLGKLWQSEYCGYENWDKPEIKVGIREQQEILGFYSQILRNNAPQVRKKAMFYCALHLFRMIPYQAKRNIKRAEKALSMTKELLK